MHRLWNIPELTKTVIGYLGKSDLARLARVSQYFWSVSIPSIFQTVSNPRDLIPLLPEPGEYLDQSLYENEGNPSITPSWLASPASTRFHTHAHLVKKLEFAFGHGYEGVMPEVATHQRLWPSIQNFPNVRDVQVDIYGHHPDLQAFIFTMLPSALRTLGLWIGDGPESSLEDALTCLARILDEPSDFESLEKLVVETDWSRPLPQDVYGILGSKLRAHDTIRTLTLNLGMANFQDAFVAASVLPNLQEATFISAAEDFLLHPTTPIPTTGFNALGQLRLATYGPENMAVALAAVTSPVLKCIELSDDGEDRDEDDPVGWRDIGRFTTLQSIQLACVDGGLVWANVSPLLPCSRLRDLTISTNTGVHKLVDADLALMAEAWPQLRRLEIWEQWRGVDVTFATLRGISSFAEFCPHLEVLQMSLDATEIRESDVEAITHHASSLTVLDLLCSRVGEHHEEVARYIVAMCPRLQRGNTFIGHIGASPGWRVVWQLVKEKLLASNPSSSFTI